MTNINYTAATGFTPSEVAVLLGKEVRFLSDKPLMLGGKDISKLLGKPCFQWKKGDQAVIWQAESWDKRITLNLINKNNDIIEIDKEVFDSALILI